MSGAGGTRYQEPRGGQEVPFGGPRNLKLHTRVLGRRRLTRSGVEVHDTRTTPPPYPLPTRKVQDGGHGSTGTPARALVRNARSRSYIVASPLEQASGIV